MYCFGTFFVIFATACRRNHYFQIISINTYLISDCSYIATVFITIPSACPSSSCRKSGFPTTAFANHCISQGIWTLRWVGFPLWCGCGLWGIYEGSMRGLWGIYEPTQPNPETSAILLGHALGILMKTVAFYKESLPDTLWDAMVLQCFSLESLVHALQNAVKHQAFPWNPLQNHCVPQGI